MHGAQKRAAVWENDMHQNKGLSALPDSVSTRRALIAAPFQEIVEHGALAFQDLEAGFGR